LVIKSSCLNIFGVPAQPWAGMSFFLLITHSTTMPRNKHIRLYLSAILAGLLGLVVLVSYRSSMTAEKKSPPKRDINTVLADHDRQLLAKPGVVGVYVGLLDDQKTLCLKVMLSREDPELKRAIPPVIEGYPVVSEVTGEIRPMDPKKQPK